MQLTRGYKKTDVGIIPEDWVVRRVGEMGDVRAGKALAVNGPGPLRPYLRTMNVFDGRIDLNDVLQMPMTDSEFSLYKLKYGDVLLNEGQSLELVGRCAMYKEEFRAPCGIQNALVRFRANEGVCPEFSTHLFRHCQHTGVFATVALQTTSVAHLGVSRFQNLELAWPPDEREQRAIAEALSDVDALIHALDALIAKKRHIKQGTMQQLLTGKKRLPGFARQEGTITTEIGCIPSDWTAAPLSELTTSIASGRTTTRSESAAFPLYGSTGVIGHTEAAEYEGPCILVARVGANAGRVYAVSGQYGVSDNTLMVSCGDNVNLNFVFLQLFARRLNDMVFGSGQPLITGSQLKNLLVAVPPTLPEQEGIAGVIGDMDAEITALEQKRDKTKLIKQGMMQELLTGRTRLVGGAK